MWTPHDEYCALASNPRDRQRVYRSKFKMELDQDVLDDIRLSVNTGFVLGNEKFRRQVEELSGIPQTFQKRGRPPTSANAKVL